MKSLALYIDKWYIVGAVNTDGITRLVNLPNREDRIWLYFYEDVANDEISYGKGFQSKFRNNEPHYYGDVFSLITQSSAQYTMFKRFQPMKGIFKSSKIFDDLRKDMDEDGDITTYISFSKDISLASRLLFIEELKEERFVVQESVARICHLALEYAAKKSNYTEDGYYLVLNACNENLHYALYQKTDDLFNREKEDVLEGLGTDVRSRALIENVVDNINEREYLLKTKEERESEYLRMNQFVDDWLVKLASARSYIPVELTNVTLSRDPFKNYPVQVKKSKIDERTDKIVKDIINVIVRFVKDAGVSHEQIKGILFLGNTFTNIQFKKELRSYYNLDNCKMVSYKDSDLSSLVSAYTFIDCSQFSAAQNVMRGNAEAELRRIKIAEAEAAAMKRAKEEADAKAAIEKEATEAERKFKDAMDIGYDAEREHDYDKMEEFFNIALTLRPDDEEAKQKHEEALRKKAELSVQQNHYKEKIQQARAAYDENDYETAKFKAEEALSFMSDSKEALRIKEDSIRRIKSQKELERYLNRADLFIAQKAYSEAIQELQKAKLLDVDYKDIIERETRIKKEQQATNSRVEELSKHLNSALNEGQYDDAITACNELIEVDFTNSRKWSARISDINIKKELFAQKQAKWNVLQSEIKAAQWDENYTKMLELCKNALLIFPNDPEVLDLFNNAEIKAKKQKVKSFIDEASQLAQSGSYTSAIDILNKAIQIDKNDKELSELLNMYSDKLDIVTAKAKEIEDLLIEKEKSYDYKSAIDLCSRLMGIDKENKEKWKSEHSRLQSLQIEKSDLELNFRRKKADIKQLIRSGNYNSALDQIDFIKKKYHSFGINSHDNEFKELIKDASPQKVSEEKQQKTNIAHRDDKPYVKGKRVLTDKKSTKDTCKSTQNVQASQKPKIIEPLGQCKTIDNKGLNLLKNKLFIQAKRYFALQKDNSMAEICTDLIKLEKANRNGTISPEESEQLKVLYKKLDIS